MPVTMSKVQPEILCPEDSAFWREGYLEAFIDTASPWYEHHIALLRQYSDGMHYEGYLWECLRKWSKITIERLRLDASHHGELFVLADDHSRDKIPGGRLWPYRSCSVARFDAQLLLRCLDVLPDDIYIFDSTLSWTLIATHEDDGKRRICVAVP